MILIFDCGGNFLGGIVCPFVLLIVATGDAAVVIGLWPLHLVWSIYCIARFPSF